MNEVGFLLLAVGVFVVLVLQLVLLGRKPRFETPADLNARLTVLEQSTHSLSQASARSEAASERIEQQLRLFTESTVQGFEAFADAAHFDLWGKLRRRFGGPR